MPALPLFLGTVNGWAHFLNEWSYVPFETDLSSWQGYKRIFQAAKKE